MGSNIDRLKYRHIYDTIVVGSGLTGGWVAKELAEAGLEVLVLEAGPSTDLATVCDLSCWTRERRIHAARRQPIQSKNPSYWRLNPTLFVDDIDHPYVSDDKFVWIRGRQVGGRSLTWRGVCLRFSDYEFEASERDGFGASWPLRYGDLAPFYDKVERFLKIQGSTDGLEQLPDGLFEAPPDLTDSEMAFKAIVEGRWKDRRVIVSRGIPLGEASPRGSQPLWPPQSNLGGTLAAATSTGRAIIRPNSIVSHLLVDSHTGDVNGAACIDRVSKESFEVRSRLVILCASTIESVRILLNSKCPQHPYGIGNSSGLLGHFLCDHMAVNLFGVIPGTRTSQTVHSGGPHGICLPRFRNLRHDDRRFLRGYGITGALERGFCREGSTWGLCSVAEVLPRQENSVRLDETVVDAWGLKIANVCFHYSENEVAMKQDATTCMLEMAHAANLTVQYGWTTAPGEYVHELGGARMGAHPLTSVLNAFNQCWDTKTLFVCDGSCFVTAGWQNPSLTMMALAVRMCDFIRRAISRRDL